MENNLEDQPHFYSFKYAFSGLTHALKVGRNFRIQAAIGLAVVIAAWLFDFSRIEWIILLVTISLVLTAELLNTIIELLVDIAVKEQILPKARLVKDISAAFVLLLSLFAATVGLILFVPHIWQALKLT